MPKVLYSDMLILIHKTESRFIMSGNQHLWKFFNHNLFMPAQENRIKSTFKQEENNKLSEQNCAYSLVVEVTTAPAQFI